MKRITVAQAREVAQLMDFLDQIKAERTQVDNLLRLVSGVQDQIDKPDGAKRLKAMFAHVDEYLSGHEQKGQRFTVQNDREGYGRYAVVTWADDEQADWGYSVVDTRFSYEHIESLTLGFATEDAAIEAGQKEAREKAEEVLG